MGAPTVGHRKGAGSQREESLKESVKKKEEDFWGEEGDNLSTKEGQRRD